MTEMDVAKPSLWVPIPSVYGVSSAYFTRVRAFFFFQLFGLPNVV